MAKTSRQVVILGAGINGCAIARELALNGVSVSLIDSHDIASGTTAYSSRLIHGGLRYLEYGELRLVRESLAERGRLLRLAPHLVRPLELFIPVTNRWRGWLAAAGRFAGLERFVPAGPRRGLFVVRIGLWLYDLLAHDSSLPPHRVLRTGEQGAPLVDARRYPWLCGYCDAQAVYPERLTIEFARDAQTLARETGADFQLHAYHEASLTGGAVVAKSTLGGRQIEIVPDMIVNATGAWVDQTLRRLHVPAERLIGGTKGSHLVTFQPRLRELLRGEGIYAEAADGRPVFVLPFGEGALIGTTDLPYDLSPETAIASADEIEYLLACANAVFPQAELTRDDVAFHYSGVRPLPFVSPTSPGAVTRRHFLRWHEDAAVPLLSVIGGKLTTCRSLAEQAAREIMARWGQTPGRTSAQRPLPGGADYPASPDDLAARQSALAARLCLAPAQVEAAWRLLGSLAETALGSRTDKSENLPGTNLPRRLAAWMIEHEWVRSVEDLVERRLMLLYDQRLTISCLVALAELLVEAGRLPGDQLEQAAGRCAERCREHFGREVKTENDGQVDPT